MLQRREKRNILSYDNRTRIDIYSLYCTNRAFSCDVITFKITKENRKQLQDRYFYGDLHEMSDILIMLLICVESNKIPYLWFFNRYCIILLITYCTSCTPRWQFISSIWNCDHVIKTLYRTRIHISSLKHKR